MSTLTLHQRIRTDIERRILNGDWAPGRRIPFEHELMKQYHCARMTVSKAVASLVEAGLIVRRKRAGSFVAEPRMHAAILEIPDIQADVLARGAAYSLKLLSQRQRRPVREAEKTLAGKGALLALRCLHLANGTPFALEERLIGLAAVPEARTVDFSTNPPGTWLLRHVAWTEAENRILALNADRTVAAKLHIEPGAACLAVERRTWRGAEHITHVRQIFPGDRFDLSARFAPHQRG